MGTQSTTLGTTDPTRGGERVEEASGRCEQYAGQVFPPTVRRPREGSVGYAPGVFDLFHIGHLNLLRRARLECDYLVAGVVSDEMAMFAKGKRPVIPDAERVEILRHIDLVDEVHLETQPDKLLTWAEVKFDIFLKGDDWQGTPKGRDLERRFAQVGVEVRYFPYTVSTSSTLLTQFLAEWAHQDKPALESLVRISPAPTAYSTSADR